MMYSFSNLFIECKISHCKSSHNVVYMYYILYNFLDNKPSIIIIIKILNTLIHLNITLLEERLPTSLTLSTLVAFLICREYINSIVAAFTTGKGKVLAHAIAVRSCRHSSPVTSAFEPVVEINRLHRTQGHCDIQVSTV